MFHSPQERIEVESRSPKESRILYRDLRYKVLPPDLGNSPAIRAKSAAAERRQQCPPQLARVRTSLALRSRAEALASRLGFGRPERNGGSGALHNLPSQVAMHPSHTPQQLALAWLWHNKVFGAVCNTVSSVLAWFSARFAAQFFARLRAHHDLQRDLQRGWNWTWSLCTWSAHMQFVKANVVCNLWADSHSSSPQMTFWQLIMILEDYDSCSYSQPEHTLTQYLNVSFQLSHLSTLQGTGNRHSFIYKIILYI